MKNTSILSRIFVIAAILLSYAMCIFVSFELGVLVCENRHFLTSFPAWVALLYAIPFAVAIGVCLLLSFIFKRRGTRRGL